MTRDQLAGVEIEAPAAVVLARQRGNREDAPEIDRRDGFLHDVPKHNVKIRFGVRSRCSVVGAKAQSPKPKAQSPKPKAQSPKPEWRLSMLSRRDLFMTLAAA